MTQSASNASTDTVKPSEEKPSEACRSGEQAEPQSPKDSLVTTHHTLETKEGTLRYTARSGRVVVSEEEVVDDVYKGYKPRIEMAVTSYTLDDTDVTKRPIMFVFNGGPGSASLWLHLGVMGPRLADMGEVDALTPPPFGLVDNPQTPLRATDLVFIDPMSTGHSRPTEGGKAKDFWGYQKDVEQITEFIRLWITRENRWLSPKFLCGESYGTIRGVGVAARLEDHCGMALNGIVLISSVLDFTSQNFDARRWDDSCIGFLPTYAALGYYHGLVEAESVESLCTEVEVFAQTRYRLALSKGNELDKNERDAVAEQIARYTGLKKQYVLDWNLRVEHWRFCGELLRDRGLNIGRLDGRFTGPKAFRGEEAQDSDPSADKSDGSYVAAMQYYLRSELGVSTDLPYQVFSEEAIKAWNYKEFEGKEINVTEHLERVLRKNPFLQVRIEYGYYDLATPWGAARDMFRHLNLPEGAVERIEHSVFPTGHMPYMHGPSREREANEITEFVRRASNR